LRLLLELAAEAHDVSALHWGESSSPKLSRERRHRGEAQQVAANELPQTKKPPEPKTNGRSTKLSALPFRGKMGAAG
jgi:hypothetical protein